MTFQGLEETGMDKKSKPLGDVLPAVTVVGESLRVYNKLIPHWQRHMAGEITREEFDKIARATWDEELAGKPIESEVTTTWTP